MRKLTALLLLMVPFAVLAQKKDKNSEKIAKTITAEDMKKHLFTIASAEMEGRDTPSPGLEKAANYIEDHFKTLGLLPGNKDTYRQYYPLYKDSILGSSMKVNGAALEMNKDFLPQPSNYTGEMRFSEVVFAGYGIIDGDKRDDYKDLKVAGKLVMILDGAPADYKPAQTGTGVNTAPNSIFGKLVAAQSKGATAVVVVGTTLQRRTGGRGPGSWTINGYNATQPVFTFNITPDVAAKILGVQGNVLELAKTGSVESRSYRSQIELGFSKTTRTTQVSNVLGVVEGSDLKDEYVFITAHYDHVGKRGDSVIYYGADDDGSGTTGVLELAQAFAEAKKAGKGPRRSIVFMTVSGEEKGLLGSRYYSENPVFPLEKTTVDLNIDMIGRTGQEYLKDKDSTNYIYIIGDDKLSTDLAVITDNVNNTYTKMKLDRKYNDPNDVNRFYFRSDHYNFAEKGVPIIFYFNGVHADYHKPTDTPDKINYSMMAKRTQLVFYTAWEMANRNEMLKRDLKLERPRAF